MVRKSIGDCSVMTLQEAREQAMTLISDLMQGKDPFADTDTPIPTLSEVYDYYTTNKPKLKKSTIDGYDRQIKIKLSDWLDTLLNDIEKKRT